MDQLVNKKISKIEEIWRYYLLESKYLRNVLKIDNEYEVGYVSHLLGYYHDTNQLIFTPFSYTSNNDRISKQISLLQSIYVQQDFIEELLRFFKLNINKGSLKQDHNYSINRDIRNELVGHPIRRINNNGSLISSCLFGYEGGSENISYLKYHADNNFKCEIIELSISDIITRHKEFLIKYLDKILHKLKKIFSGYITKLRNLRELSKTKNFEELLNITSVFFESIFDSDYIYDKESLLIVYSKKDQHLRYQNIIIKFYQDLEIALIQKIKITEEMFSLPEEQVVSKDLESPIINLQIIDAENYPLNRPVTYHYELGKLSTMPDLREFRYYSECLKSKCLNNQLVLDELTHMENNNFNKIEYYSALELIQTELSKAQ